MGAAVAKAAAGALFAVGMVADRFVKVFVWNLHAQRVVKMELDWFDHEGHLRFPCHADLQLLAWHAVSLAVFDEIGARFEPKKIHMMAHAVRTEQLDPFKTAWTGTIVVFTACAYFFYLA